MKQDEPLLEALARVAEEEEVLRADPRWQSLADGTISDVDRVALSAVAETSDAGRAALAAFTPLGEQMRERSTDAILAGLAASGGHHRPDGSTPATATEDLPPRPRRAARVAVGLALAAAMMVAATFAWRPSEPPLPAYALVLEGGDKVQRVAEPSAGRSRLEAPRPLQSFQPTSRMELTLRPDTTVKQPVAVRAWLVRGDDVRVWTPPVEIASTGVARIEGTAEALFPGVESGRWEIFVLVGRPDALPIDLRAARADTSTPRRWTLLRESIELAPREP